MTAKEKTTKSSMDLYVAPVGDDRNPGTIECPLASLERAREAVRERKAKGAGPVAVYLRGGTYFLNEPFTLRPEDSGGALEPVTYAAYPGEVPVLSAGVLLTGWVDNRVSGRPAWVADAPTWPFNQLWVDGHRRHRPRLPRQGLYRVNDAPPSKGPYVGQNEFTAEPGVVSDWHNLHDVDAVVMTAWLDSRMPIESVDESSGLITSGYCASLRMHTDGANPSRFYLDNVFEAFDEPGLWYHDRGMGKVFYLPLPGEDPSTTEIIIPRLKAVLHIQGDPDHGRFVEHIHFKGVFFAHSEWWREPTTPVSRWELHDDPDMRVRRCYVRQIADDRAADMQCAVSVTGAVEAVGARHCAFSRCTVAHAGNYGIELGRGCSDNEIAFCDFHDLGGGGVKLGTQWVDDAPASGHNRLTDCDIFDVGLLFHAAVGIWLGETGNNTVAHNSVHDLFYSGISIGWTWGYQDTGVQNNLVEYNHVYDAGKGWLYDMGGIYLLGRAPGTIVRFNKIHDIRSDDGGAVGLYFDEGSSNVVGEYNLIYRVQGDAFHQNYGEENILRNNIFAFGTRSQLARGREDGGMYFTAAHNIIYFEEGVLLGWKWTDENWRMRSNIYWDARNLPIKFARWSWEEWRRRGNDGGGLIADPKFADPAGGNFALLPDSPAVDVGFIQFDLSPIGPRGPVGAETS